MITSIGIIAVSLALFIYWFRYSCVLILSAKSTQDFAASVAHANHLSFLDVRSALASPDADLDRLHQMLQRDYRVVSYLAKNSAGAGASIESIMLAVDYQAVRIWFSITRSLFPAQARAAVAEMAEVVGFIADSMGERNALPAEF